MAKFTTRVLLHPSSADSYHKLHVQMELFGFSRIIGSGDGRVYILPEGEYDYQGGEERKDVLEKAKSAVQASGLAASILVTESKGRIWYGLQLAK